MLNQLTPLEHDLRGGEPPWKTSAIARSRQPLASNISCDILVVGAGITGSLIAQHLASRGREVCVIDRERPGFGSTAASTAMLQWEIDRSLSELTALYGFERAALIYRKSLEAVAGLQDLVAGLEIACDFRARHSLYLAGLDTPAQELLQEHELRKRAGLPGDYLGYLDLKREFGFDRAAALHSSGCAEANPVLLSQWMLAIAEHQGAHLFDAEALDYCDDAKRAYVAVEGGHVIEARHIILATGYIMPALVETSLHQTASSWAVCTRPQQPSHLWRERALIWEASTPYLYLRTTVDNRVIVGGEDQRGLTDPTERDRLMPAKTRAILDKLARLAPAIDAEPAFVWSGEFGETRDGLPLIGLLPNHPRIYAAYGYGGNGITFSFLASRMIGALLNGAQEEWFDAFALDRPG